MNRFYNQWRHLLTAFCLIIGPFSLLTAFENSPVLLEQYDEAAVKTVIVNEVSGLTIDSITIISSGWDNLVADVNGEWIFRFPRWQAFVSKIVRESLLLDRLRYHVSMPIPYYEFVGIRTAFVGYRKILGDPLREELYLTLDNDVRQEIAESLALFLYQLHHAVSVEEALQWGYEEYHLPLVLIEQSMLGTFSSSNIERIVNEALIFMKQHPCDPENLVLAHNDLHGENFAFDLSTKQVTGVFDFSDAVIGDYSIEFGKLFCVHHDLAFRTSEAYARLSGTENPSKPAAADYILRRAVYIQQARERGDALRESVLARMLERFVPIWDGLHK